MKEFTAESFNKQPAIAYRAADLGEAVTITHSRYPDRVFMLTVLTNYTVGDKITFSTLEEMNAKANLNAFKKEHKDD